MNASHIRFAMMALALSGSTFFQYSTAAEVALGTVFKDTPAVTLSGKIEIGDLERVQTSAKKLASGNKQVVLLLNSPGGDFLEALRIGELIRRLNAQTVVAGRIYEDESTPLSRCYSACFLIHAAGSVRHYTLDNILFDRTGNTILKETPVIGIHRPYVAASLNKQLAPADARLLYEKIETATRKFLGSVGVPQDITDTMFRTPSDEIVLITQNEFSKKIGQIQPYFHEWLKAKCGSLDPKEYDDLAQIAALRISSGRPDAVPSAISSDYASYLLSKQNEVEACRRTVVISHQRLQLDLR